MNLFGTFTEKPEKVEGNREALEEISQEALVSLTHALTPSPHLP